MLAHVLVLVLGLVVVLENGCATQCGDEGEKCCDDGRGGSCIANQTTCTGGVCSKKDAGIE